VKDAVDFCAQEVTEEVNKTGENVNTEKAMAKQWRRAANIIHTMAAIIYKRLFR